MKKINLVILGATGSIGQSTLAIVKKNPRLFNIEGVTCNSNIKKLIKIAKEFNIKKVGFNSKKIKNKSEKLSSRLKVYDNIEQFQEIITPKTDFIIFAISGLEGMNLLLQIVCLGKKIGIANKECIISLGKNLFNLANKYNTEIIPLDSEHNAIYHLSKYNNYTFNSVTITATGGPFRSLKLSKFKDITIKDALKHPVWKMGKKITIDSSTMMNKVFETIEAKNIFSLNYKNISIVTHPKSYIHSLIKFKNGLIKIIAHDTNMKIPIFNSIYKSKDKVKINSNKINFDILNKPQFNKVNVKRFPLIKILNLLPNKTSLFETILVSANDELVNLFLLKKIKFSEISKKLINFINKAEFKKYKSIMPKKAEEIMFLNKYVRSKINSKSI